MKNFVKKWLPVIIICAIIVVVVGIIAAVTATASDEDRFEYELSEDGTYYIVSKLKDSYSDGWFCNDSLTVPSTYDGLPVKEIKELKTTGTKEIIISEGIETISGTAFSSDTALTTVVLPDSLTSIGKKAFKSCFNLSTINLPKDLTSIGADAFQDCESLSSMTIDNNEYEFYDGILYKKSNSGKDIISIAHAVGELTLIDGLSELKSNAFEDYQKLTDIILPEGVSSIGSECFLNCQSLTSITIPKSVTEIEEKAFNKCKALTTINYTGTTEEWNAISKGKQWILTTAEKGTVISIICTDGTLTIEN